MIPQISDIKGMPNTTKLILTFITLYYSYQTVIAFYTGETGLVIRENDWSTTTGKHLNAIDPDKKKRISGEEFETRLKDVIVENRI